MGYYEACNITQMSNWCSRMCVGCLGSLEHALKCQNPVALTLLVWCLTARGGAKWSVTKFRLAARRQRQAITQGTWVVPMDLCVVYVAWDDTLSIELVEAFLEL